MQNNHIAVVQAIAQNVPPWLGFVYGHFSLSGTLSIIAFVTTIAYNIVNIRHHLRNKK